MIIKRYGKIIDALKTGWNDNPLLTDLETALKKVKKLWI